MKKIVFYKLGNLEHKIIPTKAACEKLRESINQMQKNDEGSLIWGPELEIQVIDIENAEHTIVEPVDINGELHYKVYGTVKV